MILNVDDAPYSYKHGSYGGASGTKDGLIINGADWLVKYPKNAEYLNRHEEMSYTMDPVSEYLGSHVYEILGIPVHETMLVERRGKIAVACKDFENILEGEKLLEFRTLKNAANNDMTEELERRFSSTGSNRIANFEETLLHLKYNGTINTIEGIKERFFDMIVIDAFINNGDRNNGNWGILRTRNGDSLAPVYDNGGSFNGKTPDSRLKRMLENESVMKESGLSGVSAFGDEHNFLAKDLMAKDIDDLQISLVKLTPLIDAHMQDFYELIDSVDDIACSPVRKDFYKQSLAARLDCILSPAYERAVESLLNKGYELLQTPETSQLIPSDIDISDNFLDQEGIDPADDD